MITRAQIVEQARTWLDTPFHHMARSKGLGVDCAGLLIGVARELGLVAPDFDVPAYSPTPDGHSLLAWADRYMRRIGGADMQAGDAIALITDVDPQHLGILADYRHGGFAIIHACNARSCTPPRVIETRLMFSRAMRFVAAYAFPADTTNHEPRITNHGS